MFARYLKLFLSKESNQRDHCFRMIKDGLTQPALLERVFNEFPFECEEEHVIDKTTLIRWVDQYNAAINAISIQQGEDQFYVALDHTSKKAIENWISEVIRYACRELLHIDGKLKQDIVDVLGLQTIRDAWQKDQTKDVRNIELHIIYSYCIQLLFGATDNYWQKNLAHSFIENEGDPRACGMVTRHLHDLFYKDQGWAPFYLQQVENNNYVIQLQKIAEENLDAEIIRMTQEEKSPLSILPLESTAPSEWAKRIELWIELMDGFRQQQNMALVRAIHQMISSKIRDTLEYDILYPLGTDNVQQIEKYQLSPHAQQQYSAASIALDLPCVITLDDVPKPTTPAPNMFYRFVYKYGMYPKPTRCATEEIIENRNLVYVTPKVKSQ